MSQTFSNIPKSILHAYSAKIQYNLSCPEVPFGRTKQSFKAECDINTILKRFLRTGVLDFVNKNAARYGDATGFEYTAAMNTVAAAQSLFNDLPSSLRSRFENDPAKFLDFVHDDKNIEEARSLGLLKPQEPTSTPPATPLAAPSPAAAPAAP